MGNIMENSLWGCESGVQQVGQILEQEIPDPKISVVKCDLLSSLCVNICCYLFCML